KNYQLKGKYQFAGVINLVRIAAALGVPSFSNFEYILSAKNAGSFLLNATRTKSGQRVPSNEFSSAPSFTKPFSMVNKLSLAGTTISCTLALKRIPIFLYQSARKKGTPDPPLFLASKLNG